MELLANLDHYARKAAHELDTLRAYGEFDPEAVPIVFRCLEKTAKELSSKEPHAQAEEVSSPFFHRFFTDVMGLRFLEEDTAEEKSVKAVEALSDLVKKFERMLGVLLEKNRCDHVIHNKEIEALERFCLRLSQNGRDHQTSFYGRHHHNFA